MASRRLLVPFLVAWHWQRLGWRDWHYNYPATPTGYTQIVNRFGQPCNADARAIRAKQCFIRHLGK